MLSARLGLTDLLASWPNSISAVPWRPLAVVYLEYFYFVLYIILLLQTVNSVIFTVSDDFHFIEHGDNLYPKVIFFPITLGIMFLVTAVTFF
jgi:hypothetical protein